MIPKSNNPALHHVDSGVSDLRVVLNEDYKYGLIDSEGRMISVAKYDKIWTYNKFGLAMTEVEGKLGFIGTDGLMVVNNNLLSVSEFYDDGYARVELEEIAGFYSVGIINAQGRYISKYTFKK